MSSSNPTYTSLLSKVQETTLLGATEALLSWDQEALMPSQATPFRAKQLALLARLTHEATTSDEVGELLAACEASPPATEAAVANLRLLRKSYDRATRVPAALVAEIAEATSLAQEAWAQARKDSDFPSFQPWMEKVLGLFRQKADCLGAPEGGEAWDALAEDYESGMRAKDVEPIFSNLRGSLRELLGKIRDNGTPPDRAFRSVSLPVDAQERFVRRVAAKIGFDFDRGRMDRSVHPFCSGTHWADVRFTTRYKESDMLDCLGSVMHEAGHGMYEQGLPREHEYAPVGKAVSLGVHESQSRLWENQVGRSRAFWRWAIRDFHDCFGPSVAAFDAEGMYRISNLAEPGYIRVESDELSYNLHVMLRFEMELALFRGDLKVADLPAAWNERFQELVGLEVKNDAEGCLQDVHWCFGLFGYFPTYTLGNLYAAQLFEKAEESLPGLDASFEKGEFEPLLSWLREKVHSRGSMLEPRELVEEATGQKPSADALIRYLDRKLSDVYGIESA